MWIQQPDVTTSRRGINTRSTHTVTWLAHRLVPLHLQIKTLQFVSFNRFQYEIRSNDLRKRFPFERDQKQIAICSSLITKDYSDDALVFKPNTHITETKRRSGIVHLPCQCFWPRAKFLSGEIWQSAGCVVRSPEEELLFTADIIACKQFSSNSSHLKFNPITVHSGPFRIAESYGHVAGTHLVWHGTWLAACQPQNDREMRTIKKLQPRTSGQVFNLTYF